MAGSSMIREQIEALKSLKGKVVETGWFDSDKYHDGLSLAYVGRIVNFGCTVEQDGKKIVIPARPFMQDAYANFLRERKSIEKAIGKRLISGQINPDQAMAQIGMAIEGFIVKSIKEGAWTPNAASTVAKKGFDKPLIDTAHLWQTVNSKTS